MSRNSWWNRHPLVHLGVLVACAIAVVVLIAACGSDSSSSSSTATATTSGSETESESAGGAEAADGAQQGAAKAEEALGEYLTPPTEILNTEVLPKAPPTGKKIVALGIPSPTDEAVRKGFGEAADALGWSVKTLTYDPANPATIQGGFEQALSLQPDMVTISGTAPQLWGSSTVANYKAAHIPILVTSSAPVQTSELILGVPGGCQMFTKAGNVLGDWFITESKAAGKALFESATAYPALVCLQKGFSETVEQECSECEVTLLKVTIPQVTGGEVPAAVVNALKADPSLEYALFDAADFASGINSALNAADLSNIKVGGFLMHPEQSSALKKGTQAGWLAYSNGYLGYAGADLAARFFAGAPTTTADNEAPLQMFTPENVETVGSNGEMTAPDDALEQFKKLWKIH